MKEFQDGCRIDSWFLLLLLRNVFLTQSDYKELIKVDSVQCSVTFYHAAYVTLTLRTIIYKYRNISFIRMLRTKCSLKLLSGAAASTASPRVFDVGPEEKDIQEPCHCWTPPDLPSSPYATPIYSQCQVHNPHLCSSSSSTSSSSSCAHSSSSCSSLPPDFQPTLLLFFTTNPAPSQ